MQLLKECQEVLETKKLNGKTHKIKKCSSLQKFIAKKPIFSMVYEISE
jgi:hypothetical protein